MNILNRSLLKMKDQISYFDIPTISCLGWIRHGFLTRLGGKSPSPFDSPNLSCENGDREEEILQNKLKIAAAFGFNPDRLILLDQVHQDCILLIREPMKPDSSPLKYDALMTNVPNTFLGIRTADCLPIFIVDGKKKVIAAVHAGREGTSLNITVKVLRKMKEEFRCEPQDLLIGMGPSIGPCCYEVDEKVFLPEWEPFAIPKGNGKWMLDLRRMNIAQIEGEGLKRGQISGIDLCTCCDNHLFFSYRRDGTTGRQLSFIGII